MTRKDYIKIADMLAGEVSLASHEREATSDPEIASLWEARLTALRNVILSTADIFAQDNPRFDRQRFYAAANLEGSN